MALAQDLAAAAELLAPTSAVSVDPLSAAREAAFLLWTSAALADVAPLSRLSRALLGALDRVGAVQTAPLLGLLRELGHALLRAITRLSIEGADALLLASALSGRFDLLQPANPAAPAPPAPSPWTPLCDERLLDAFIDEAGERIESLGQKLVQLETRPQDQELIREIFRDLHTLKGSSAFVGLQPMNLLAHRAEDLVGRLHKGSCAVDRGVIDTLLSALDGLRALLDRAAGRSLAEPDLRPLLDRLSAPPCPPAPQRERRAERRSAPPVPPVGGGAAARHTLRIDFDKLDLLLNLVGELVVSKARLHSGLSSLSSLSHDLGVRLRRSRRRSRRAAQPASGPSSAAEELGRLQRLLGTVVHELADGGSHLDHVAGELRDQVMKLRMVPVSRVFNKHHRLVRELSQQLGKQVRLEIEGAETELDKMLVEQLDDPLVHLVRNAIDHGIEAPVARIASGKHPEGVLRLRARHRGSQILVSIEDDGRGVDPDRVREKALARGLLSAEDVGQLEPQRLLDLLFRAGFSTADEVSEISGRGVGLDVVHQAVSRLKGTIEIQSSLGRGTTFLLQLPLTLAIIQVLVVELGGDIYTLPLDAVSRALRVPRAAVHRLYDREMIHVSGEDGGLLEVPLIDLHGVLELPEKARADALQVVLVTVGGSSYGLVCDRQLGKREIVIKSIGELLEEAPCVAGATLIDDRVVLLLDLPQLVQRAAERRPPPAMPAPRTDGPAPALAAPAAAAAPARALRLPRILLVEDSSIERESMSRLLREAGFEVVAASDGRTAAALADSDAVGFDLISTDLTMPDVDGYDLTRRLRCQPRHRDVPILMLSARSEPIDRLRGFDAGVDEYLLKPVDPRRLLGAVRRHLQKPRASQPGEVSP